MSESLHRDHEEPHARKDGYQGAVGQTRLQAMHVMTSDGELRSLHVYRGVHVGTHPELKAKALEGELHRMPDGTELAVPFVYHDPSQAIFVLVIPWSLQYRELKERARCLSEIAEDTEHSVPDYVRRCPWVVGMEAFRQHVRHHEERDVGEATPLPERQHELQRREASLRERFRQLVQREDDLLAREQRLRSAMQSVEQLSDRAVDSEGGLPVSENELHEVRDALAEFDALAHELSWRRPSRGEPSAPPARAGGAPRASDPPPLHPSEPGRPSRPPLPPQSLPSPGRGHAASRSEPHSLEPPSALDWDLEPDDADSTVVTSMTELQRQTARDAEHDSQVTEGISSERPAPSEQSSGGEARLHPRRTVGGFESALELGRTCDTEALPDVLDAMGTLPPGQAATVMAAVARCGESTGDALIEALAHPQAAVRQLAALALGHLKLRRALVPLVNALCSEPEDRWPEVARALGEFGPAAMRSMTRALRERRGYDERFAVLLAHLANRGGLAQVESLVEQGDTRPARLATQALEQRARIANEDRLIHDSDAPLDPAAAAQRLSQAFYAELAYEARQRS